MPATGSEAERELDSIAYPETEVGKGTGGQ